MTLALHHIGYLVADIEASSALWSTRFGYVLESSIIEDPAQTAFVQFLRQPGSPHWLELVAPNGPGSRLAAALKTGGGLHHLCYETAEIEAAVGTLRTQGMFPISRPTPAVAFGGRRIAWLLDPAKTLVELVESGTGPLSLATIQGNESGTSHHAQGS